MSSSTVPFSLHNTATGSLMIALVQMWGGTNANSKPNLSPKFCPVPYDSTYLRDISYSIDVWWLFCAGRICIHNNQRRVEAVLQTTAVHPAGTETHP